VGVATGDRMTNISERIATAGEAWLGLGRWINDKTLEELAGFLRRAVFEGYQAGENPLYDLEVISTEVVFDEKLQKNTLNLALNLTSP
jgi:hypothetical protein